MVSCTISSADCGECQSVWQSFFYCLAQRWLIRTIRTLAIWCGKLHIVTVQVWAATMQDSKLNPASFVIPPTLSLYLAKFKPACYFRFILDLKVPKKQTGYLPFYSAMRGLQNDAHEKVVTIRNHLKNWKFSPDGQKMLSNHIFQEMGNTIRFKLHIILYLI